MCSCFCTFTKTHSLDLHSQNANFFPFAQRWQSTQVYKPWRGGALFMCGWRCCAGHRGCMHVWMEVCGWRCWVPGASAFKMRDNQSSLWDCRTVMSICRRVPRNVGNVVGKYAITMHAWLCHTTCVHVLHNYTSLLWIHTYTLIMSMYTTYPQL